MPDNIQSHIGVGERGNKSFKWGNVYAVSLDGADSVCVCALQIAWATFGSNYRVFISIYVNRSSYHVLTVS